MFAKELWSVLSPKEMKEINKRLEKKWAEETGVSDDNQAGNFDLSPVGSDKKS